MLLLLRTSSSVFCFKKSSLQVLKTLRNKVTNVYYFYVKYALSFYSANFPHINSSIQILFSLLLMFFCDDQEMPFFPLMLWYLEIFSPVFLDLQLGVHWSYCEVTHACIITRALCKFLFVKVYGITDYSFSFFSVSPSFKYDPFIRFQSFVGFEKLSNLF